MATDSFVQLPLGQMVDLCLNTYQSGAVNFGLLHTTLQIILQKIDAQNLNIELHGNDATNVTNLLKGDQPNPNIKIKEIEVKNETTMVVVPTNEDSFPMPLTSDRLDSVITDVELLKQQIEELTTVPGNSKIISSVRNRDDSSTSPVLEVYHHVALLKRIEASEAAIEKLTSIVEDVIRNPIVAATPSSQVCYTPNTKQTSSRTSVVGAAAADDKNAKKKTSEMLMVSDLTTGGALNELIEEVARIRKIIDEYVLMESTETTTPTSAEPNNKDEEKPKHMNLQQLIQDVEEIKDLLFKRKKPSASAVGEEQNAVADVQLPPDLQLAVMEERFKEYTEHLQQLDRTFNDELAKLHNQFTDIEKDFNDILTKIQIGLPAGDKSLDEPNQCCGLVYQKMVQLQSDFEQLTDTSLKLLDDKDDKQRQMDEMLETIELLKTIKMDRDDIEEALADKADACTVHRKVSHDQFDTACDELTKGIEEALEKLTQQENLWQLALEDIQNEIGNKLDKMDLGPLREFINNKLRLLQDKMKSLSALKREQEAAGTKSKYLRDVQCISCDKDVVMRKEMDATLRPMMASVPPTRNMGPYLAYELDALRKQQKTIPGSKNLNNLETAMGSARGPKKADNHICNRYCGGSHTITTPQQRVTRLGHFLMQWGPEAMRMDTQPEQTVVATAAAATADDRKSIASQVQAKTSIIIHGDIPTSKEKSLTKTPSLPKPTSKASLGRTGSGVQKEREPSKRHLSSADGKRTSRVSITSKGEAKSATGLRESRTLSKAAVETIVEEAPQNVDAQSASGVQRSSAEALETTVVAETTAVDTTNPPPPTEVADDEIVGVDVEKQASVIAAEQASTAADVDAEPPPPAE